MYILTD